MVEGDADNRKYAPWWDVLRLVAALDIVGHHVGSSYVFGGVGLPIFLIAGTALGVSRTPLKPLPVFVEARVRRILLPWLFWSVLIGVGMVIENLLSGESILQGFKWEMLLYGPQIHLWFLPYIVGAGVMTYLVFRWANQLGRSGAYRLTFLVGLIGALVLMVLPVSSLVGWPLQQWIFGAAAIPIGVVMGRCFQVRKGSYWDGWEGLAVLGLLLAIHASPEAWWGFDAGMVATRYLVAYGLLLWFSGRHARRLAPFRWASALSKPMMGVYILHPAVFQWVVLPLGLYQGEGMLTVIITFGLSLGLVVALQRTRLRRFL